jgi:Family of unknown function (DUF5947)
VTDAVSPLTVLSRIRQPRPTTAAPAGERCELCGESIDESHGHLVDLELRSLRCACRGCYLLFTPEGAGGNRFRAVPDRYVSFPEFRLTPSQWNSLQIPVAVAFFFVNSALGRVAAFYPSPAGATESLLPLDSWAELVDANPDLSTLVPDVEAFLVRYVRGDVEPQCFLVPIDVCYELVGTLRQTWRGFDGGTDAHRELDAFFDRVRSRAQPVSTGHS